MVAVAVSNLYKHFGETVVLDGVDVEVPDGSFAVLVGPSGCGKSTLLRLIAGLERPTRGSIRFGTRDVTALAPRDRDIAMVFQSYALYPHLSVRDNLGFGLKLRGQDKRAIADRVDEVSKMLGLSALLERMPRQLSGGQRQRVAMGRAIARRPALFLFDEPLSNLDAALRAQVRVDIKRLHGELGTTSVYVTHDQVEAMTLADVMFVLNAGKVEQRGAPLDVYDAPATRFVAGFLGSPAMNFLEGRVDKREVALGEGVRVPVAPERFELLDGQEVTLGIRPHDLTVGGALPFEVTIAEALGGETYAHGTLAGQPVVVRLEADQRVRAGDRLELAAGTVHLFDRESGRSMRC